MMLCGKIVYLLVRSRRQIRCLPPLTPGVNSLPVADVVLLLAVSTPEVARRACMMTSLRRSGSVT